MAPVKDYLSGSGADAIRGAGPDWSLLPEDMLVSVLRAVHVVDAIRSGAVCTSWYAAYAAFRRHRLPTPRQPPCLLYASDAVGPDAAALHCPATGATLQIPFQMPPLDRRPLLGSGHGWLVTADEASNLHLLNPVNGAQVALPPITALHHVESSTDQERGDAAYNVFENLVQYNIGTHQYEVDTEPTVLEQRRAYEFVYERVVLSASPSVGRACVVLLLHKPYGEVSFARLGDERWTWIDTDAGLPWKDGYRAAMHSSVDSLFYLVQRDAAMYSLDLSGPSPVARRVLRGVPGCVDDKKYLVQTPSGDFLQIWRERESVESSTPVELPPHYVDDDDIQDPCSELKTLDLQLYKVNLQGQRVERIKSLPDHALFLGFNNSMCLPVKDFPGLKPNCAYLTDDDETDVNIRKYNRREIGIWSIPDESISALDDVSSVIYPWLNWPSPIWIQPSFL